MPTQTCQACGVRLPQNLICRCCGEDHRGWFARLTRNKIPVPLVSQEYEILSMTLRIKAQRQELASELGRVNRHQAASATGQAVIEETILQLQKGLSELDATEQELVLASLGVAAVRARVILEAIREGLAGQRPLDLPVFPEGSRVVGHPSGAFAVQHGTSVSFYTAYRPLKPAWTQILGSGELWIGGSRHPAVVVGQAVFDEKGKKIGVLPNASKVLLCGERLVLENATEVGVYRIFDLGLEQRIPHPGKVLGVWLVKDELLLHAEAGLQLWDGGVLQGSGRFGSTVVPRGDRVLAFPMLLQLPDLRVLAGFSRPVGGGSGSFCWARIGWWALGRGWWSGRCRLLRSRFGWISHL